MSEVLRKYKSDPKLVDGYRVVELSAGEQGIEQALLLAGEYSAIIPLKNNSKKIYLEVTTKCNFD